MLCSTTSAEKKTQQHKISWQGCVLPFPSRAGCLMHKEVWVALDCGAAIGTIPAARYLGTGAVNPLSKHPSVGEGEQTKLPSSNRGCWGSKGWGLVRPQPVWLHAWWHWWSSLTLLLPPCTGWGMQGAVWGEWFGLGSLFSRSVPASGVALCQRYPSASYTNLPGAWEDAEPHMSATRAEMLALVPYSPLVTTWDKSPSHWPICSCMHEPSFQTPHKSPVFHGMRLCTVTSKQAMTKAGLWRYEAVMTLLWP